MEPEAPGAMLHTCCALCSQPAEAAVNLGRLLGPIRDTKNPAADELYVHRMCAIWSPEVCYVKNRPRWDGAGKGG